jgi:hypothetical protein
MSRRLKLFVAALLLLLVAPLVVGAVLLARALFVPPVPGARFIGFDRLQVDGSCTNNPSSLGGRVLDCNASFRADSQFAILNHDSGAVAWCIERISDSHMDHRSVTSYGPLIVGRYPTVAPDYGGCTQMLPITTGLFAELILKH